MNSYRGGMQVHAVPPEERAYDSRGQQLPWGYSYAGSESNRKQPLEKGPFGRATNRRSLSRSKTATPSTKDDLARQENNRFADDIFNNFRAEQEEKQPHAPPRDTTKSQSSGALTHTRSAQQEVNQPSTTSAPAGPTPQPTPSDPVEVIIYGFAPEFQFSAIEYYETASRGRIYEDYDRYPPNPKYSTSLSLHALPIPRSLSKAAIRRINTYQGGEHWIKVTFDSPTSADAAMHFSPAILNGHLVYAEPFRGEGPAADAALFPNSAGGATAGTLVNRRPPQASFSSARSRGTFSSMPSRIHSAPAFAVPDDLSNSISSSTTSSNNTAVQNGAAASPPPAAATTATDLPTTLTPPPTEKPLRIPTAVRAQLRPASEALLPVPPWTQRMFGGIPLVGALFGGDASAPSSSAVAQGQGAQAKPAPPAAGGIWGAAIPRKADGTSTGDEIDWERASFWWRACWWMDWAFGTDLMGLKGGDG